MRTFLAGITVMAACGGGGSKATPDAARDAEAADAAPNAADVTGRWLDTYHYAGGTAQSAGDLSTTTVGAVVWNGTSWDSYPGTGAADGTFTIHGVPQGEFTLQIGEDSIVTSARSIDYGADLGGRPDATFSQSAQTAVHMTWSGVDPWTASSELELTSGETGAWEKIVEAFATPAPTVGATSFDMSVMWLGEPLINGGAGQHLVGVELQPASAAGVGYIAATRTITTAASFEVVDGAAASFTGAMTAVTPDHSISLDWRRSAFDANIADINPGAQPLNFELGVAVMPTSSSLGVTEPFGHVLHVPLAPLPSTDVDLGTLMYGNPLGPDEGTFVYASRSFDTVLGLTGAGNTAFLSTIDVNRAATDTTPIAPIVTPVRSIQIAGNAATGTLSGVGLTPLVTWSQPATGTPTHYLVIVYQASNVGGVTELDAFAPYLTTSPQLQITPDVLVTGQHYLISVRAVSEPGVDSQSHPFRHSLPMGDADAHTGIFSP